MRKQLALALFSLTFFVAAGAGTATDGRVSMVPARLVQCTLGRALNLDARQFQSIGDVEHEGAHRFAILLPPVPKDQGPPLDPAAEPEPVDPAVRVVDDPDGIARDMGQPFYRVVDRWPERVEMVGRVHDQPYMRFIVISEIDVKKGTANLSTTRAADAASLDLKNVYQGGCSVKILSSDS